MIRILSRPIVAGGLGLVVIVAVLAASGLLVRTSTANAFAAEHRLRTVRVLADGVLRLQLDEETGIRGFAATGDRLFLEPYATARTRLPARIDALAAALQRLDLPEAVAAARDAGAINAAWTRTVASAVVARPYGRMHRLELLGKSLIDRFRTDIATVDDALAARENASDLRAQRAIDRIALFAAGAILIALLAALFVFRQRAQFALGLERQRAKTELEHSRRVALQAAYAAEKRIADSLQDAIAQRPLPLLPTLRFSATYVPASEEAHVGGDWYDALELPGQRVLFAIGDVAGHGLDAAVAMSRARQALIVAALLGDDPASVLGRVNAELLRQGAPMVTAVAGYADARTYEFVYASAGHPPPVLVEPNRAPRMLEFGGVPLAVVNDAVYRTTRVQTVPGAMLVLYTDGAVEHSRDVIAGERQLLAAAARAAGTSSSDPATLIHKGIFEERPAGDDVAILTIGLSGDAAPGLTISADNATTAFSGRVARAADESVKPAPELAGRRSP